MATDTPDTAPDPEPLKFATKLEVVRPAGQAHARLYIDGKLFPYATLDGFTVHPQRGQAPSVAVVIYAESVEVRDDYLKREPLRDVVEREVAALDTCSKCGAVREGAVIRHRTDCPIAMAVTRTVRPDAG